VTTGPLTITVVPNRQVDVHVTDADGKPQKDVFVSAVSVKPGTTAAGRSDDDGSVQLALPAGDYRLTATPARSTNLIRTSDKVTVADGPTAKVSLQMQTGCILILTALDADTGQPIQGISFWREMDDKPGARTGLTTVPYYVDRQVASNFKLDAPLGDVAIGDADTVGEQKQPHRRRPPRKAHSDSSVEL
jgi:hypothetical protein